MRICLNFFTETLLASKTYLSLPFLCGWHALILLSFLLFRLAGWNNFFLAYSLRLLDYDVVLDVEFIVHINDIELDSLAIHVFLRISVI